MKPDPIHVCFACNENYRKGLWVAAGSLLRSNREHDIVIHILDGGLSASSIHQLRRIATRVHSRHEIHLHAFDESVFAGATLGPGTSHLTYARLLVGSLLPEIPRVIYLDVDILILGDLIDIWDATSENTVIAGVQDFIVQQLGDDCPWPITPEEFSRPYMNGGLLRIDLDRWRKLDLEEKALRLLSRDPTVCQFWDQTILNYLCRGRIHCLSRRYNRPPERLEEISGGGVLHYLAPEKPWAVWRPDPAFRLWRESWRRLVGPRFLLLSSPEMMMSAFRFLGIAIGYRLPVVGSALALATKWREKFTTDPVKRRILRRYRESLLARRDLSNHIFDASALADQWWHDGCIQFGHNPETFAASPSGPTSR